MTVEEYDAMIEKKYEDMINAWEIEDAKKRGFEKGYKKGVEQGIEIRHRIVMKRIVKVLFEEGYSIQFISKGVDLPVCEVEKLIEEK